MTSSRDRPRSPAAQPAVVAAAPPDPWAKRRHEVYLERREDGKGWKWVNAVAPHSEVCIHIGVAGLVVGMQLSDDCQSVQLWDAESGRRISGPITACEAGVRVGRCGRPYVHVYRGNARFWIRWNRGPVKLCLRPGQRVLLEQSGLTDEGFLREGQVFEHTGLGVSAAHTIYERDCDGRHEEHTDYWCALEDLECGPYVKGDDGQPLGLPARWAAMGVEERWCRLPSWRKRHGSQPD